MWQYNYLWLIRHNQKCHVTALGNLLWKTAGTCPLSHLLSFPPSSCLKFGCDGWNSSYHFGPWGQGPHPRDAVSWEAHELWRFCGAGSPYQLWTAYFDSFMCERNKLSCLSHYYFGPLSLIDELNLNWFRWDPMYKWKEWSLTADSSSNISESKGTGRGRWVDVVVRK